MIFYGLQISFKLGTTYQQTKRQLCHSFCFLLSWLENTHIFPYLCIGPFLLYRKSSMHLIKKSKIINTSHVKFLCKKTAWLANSFRSLHPNHKVLDSSPRCAKISKFMWPSFSLFLTQFSILMRSVFKRIQASAER